MDRSPVPPLSTSAFAALLFFAMALGFMLLLGWWARARERRILGDPTVDPGDATIDRERRMALEDLLQQDGGQPESSANPLCEGAEAFDGAHGSVAALRNAAARFKAALAVDPDSAPALMGLAEAALALCHDRTTWRAGLARALPLAERAAACAPRDPGARALLGLYRARLGHISQAEALALDLPAEDWRAQTLRAAIAQARGRKDAAREALRSAASLAPAPRRPHQLLALAEELAAHRRDEEAIEALRACLSLDAGDARAWHRLAVVLYQTRRFAEALEASDRALELADVEGARLLNEHLRRRLGIGWSPEGA